METGINLQDTSPITFMQKPCYFAVLKNISCKIPPCRDI